MRKKLQNWLIKRQVVKESFDNLPSGICFFYSTGRIILCNRQMYQLYYEMTGQELQIEQDLLHIIKENINLNGVRREEKLFHFPNQSVWKFAKRNVSLSPFYSCTEYIASNVTELFYKNKVLEENNQAEKEAVEALTHVIDNVTAITREEEILAMKMQLHNSVGACLQAVRKIYQGNCSEKENKQVLQNIENVTDALVGAANQINEVEPYAELVQVANMLGITIKVDGEIPLFKKTRSLVVYAMRECLINAIRHGNADELYVQIQKGNTCQVTITNNGTSPDHQIKEGGGLSSLRKKIQESGGSITFQLRPEFTVELELLWQ